MYLKRPSINLSNSNITRRLTFGMTSLSGGPAATKITGQPFEQKHVKSLQPGVILWLPRQEAMPMGVFIDSGIQNGAFNHPCVVLSIPDRVDMNSTIEIAYMTSKCKTLPSKNRSWRIRTSYLRIVTTTKPFAKDCLHFKKGMSIARDYSNVFLEAFKISVRALGLYERGLEYVLTSQSLKKLLNGIKSNSLRNGPTTKQRNGRSNPPNLKTNAGTSRPRTSTIHTMTRTSPGNNSKTVKLSKTQAHDPPKSTALQSCLPRRSSRNVPVKVISDTEPEDDDPVVLQPKMPKNLPTSGVSQRPNNPVLTRRAFKTYASYDDDDFVPNGTNGKRKRSKGGYGESKDSWANKDRVVKKQRKD